jgi:hypothetical protein
MQFIKDIWDFLDGKKTAIGTIMLTAAIYIEEPTIKAILTIGGQIFGGGGVVHKVKKSRNK